MQKADGLITRFRIVSIIILFIISAIISFFAVKNGCGIIIPSFKNNKDLPVEILSPYDDHGLGKEQMCKITADYAETMPADTENDKSSPLFSPLIKGTIDYVQSTFSYYDKNYFVLRSGRIVKQSDCELFDGNVMPDNVLSVNSTYTSGDTYIVLDTGWKVPFNADIHNQNYYTGYLNRIYNVSLCTASYIDFVFYYTNQASGKFNFDNSNIISRGEWITSDNNTSTLRLYFKAQGVFYGYSAYYTDDNRLVISVKNAPDKLSAAVVELDAGHGGKDCGAIGTNGVYESNINLDITMMVREKLQNYGVNVILTRNDDTFYSVDKRQSMARNSGADLFVAIHNNFSESFSSLSGPEAYYYRANSELPAKLILERLSDAWTKIYSDNPEMINKIIQPDGSIRFYPFKVTRVEECPAVLIECGYLSNQTECSMLCEKINQQIIADNIAFGILDYIETITSK